MKKQFRITLNGKTYDVVAEIVGDEEPRPSGRSSGVRSARSSMAGAAPAAPPPVAAQGEPGAVPSPLAGKVVSIDVAEGDQVEAGQQVITLEAMKMNTVVSAPAGGTVQAIKVAAGDPVEEGQSLMIIA
jgi:biotin carboxyl carrier protein